MKIHGVKRSAVRYTYIYMYMLAAKHGFAQFMDCTAQSMDPHFAQTIHGLHSVCAILGLC